MSVDDPGTTAPTTKRCPFCAEEIQAAAIVCKHCGRDLPTAALADRASVKKKKQSNPWTPVAVFLAFGFMFAMCGYAVLRTPPIPASRKPDKLLLNATESERRTLLSAVITGVGDKCGGATRTFHQGTDKDGSVTWNVACTSGTDYVVRITNDAGGSTRVVPCSTMKLVAKLECFKKLDEQ